MSVRAYIFSLLATTLLLQSGTSLAQVCLAPGQSLECSGAGCDVTAGHESGQQHEVIEADRRASQCPRTRFEDSHAEPDRARNPG